MSARFRKGDVVTIEATVDSTPFNMDDGAAKIKINFPPYHDAYVDPAQLKMVRPNIVVGDLVRCFEVSRDPGTVRAVLDEFAWVELGEGHYATWRLSRLERVDPEPVVETAAIEPPADGPYLPPLDGKVGSEGDVA